MINSSEEKRNLDLKRRGQISPEDLKAYAEFSTEHLIKMLDDSNPQKRTIDATILGNKRDSKSIRNLCASLKKENALYPRIAMSEALGKMGEASVPPLIKLLGQIGKNQEVELPKKYFNKRSFPLARDMAARTIIKIGKPATPYLIKVMEEQDDFIMQQAIDAIGGIAAKTDDKSALSVMIDGLEIHSDNKISLWKIIRALSGFKHNEEALTPLVSILKSNYDAAIIWESARTLGQINISRPDVITALHELEQTDNPEIKKASKNALINL
ncbi:HEAT repeat domain-containing protein [Methanobacterium sp. SMA-27]|uniref:HEAT repeat domain-containing protein n=1 Tax=Methanobacterium sp. SMA-27 TaxID=1495336 RepID=UPI000ADA9FD7|nr:HEAT repeat domain-containing protein [Methanobacterium sp. SMA-27]